MSWIHNFVRPRFRKLVPRREAPEDLWVRCLGCEAMVFRRDFEARHKVCGQCGHHHRLTPDERFALLFDPGSWSRVELPETPADPLRFKDRRRYAERLREAQKATGARDAVQVAFGEVVGRPAVIAAFDFRFLGGSMGVAAGEALIAAMRLAGLQGAVLVTVTASGGARMQEGMLSLMQMPRTVAALTAFKQTGLPAITVFTDPTTGGVTASFAMLGDLHLAEPGAVIGFAGSRVIEQTLRQTLPSGFQRAESLRDHGQLDQVVPRAELRVRLARLIGLLTRPRAGVEDMVGDMVEGAAEGAAETVSDREDLPFGGTRATDGATGAADSEEEKA